MNLKNRDVTALYAFLDRINEAGLRAREVEGVLADTRRYVDRLDRTWSSRHLEATAVSEAVILDATLALRCNGFGTEAYEGNLLHLASVATHLITLSRQARVGRPATREPRSVEDYE